MRMSKTAIGLLALGLASGALADTPLAGGAADTWAFKLTPSWYSTQNEKDAFDINLRANHGPHALWLGYYQRSSEYEQTRGGYEYTLDIPYGQVVPSLQLASHGFVGGSLNAQLGNEALFVLLGIGHTNTRDYYNLNFDPNDAITLGLGTNLLPKSSLSLFTVKDNRLDTGQVVTHLVWRMRPDDTQRWTVDISSKHGRASPTDDAVSGSALSITYDYRDAFLRLARDQKVNFTPDDQTRLSLGMRF